MKSSRDELLGTLEKIRGIPILVIGDIILDRYIWGSVERISPEAPVPIVHVQRIEDRLGGAGNVVRNLRSVGARVSLCGFVSDDDEGKVVLSLLEKEGVNRDGVIVDKSVPTCLKTRVIAHQQQVVRVDRETVVQKQHATQEKLAALVARDLESHNAVVLSDYGKGAVGTVLIKGLEGASNAGKISLKSRPLVVDPHPSNYGIYSGMTMAKPNRKEAEAATGIRISGHDSVREAGKILIEKWKADMIVISLGEGGLAIISKDDPNGLFLDTVARQVFDVSGAGDTLTAVMTAALAAGASPSVAGDLANIAAGVVVGEVGTVAVDPIKLKSEIEQLTKKT